MRLSALLASAILTGMTAIASAADFNPWYYYDADAEAAASANHPGITIVTVNSLSAGAFVAAHGKKVMMGFGGDGAIWANGQNTDGSSDPSRRAEVLADIDAKIINGHAMYIYIDEPWPKPGQSSATTPASVAYNVRGFNVIADHIHQKFPGVKFGLTIGDDGGAALHLTMLRAGLHEDFASAEEYNSCCTTSNPFGNQQQLFPKVQLMALVYSTESFSQGDWLGPKGVGGGVLDIISTWDTDLYGNWIGPLMDGSMSRNMFTFAATGKKDFTRLPASYVTPGEWTWDVQTKNFSVDIVDQAFSDAHPYPLDTTRCEYEVVSGPNAVNGLNAVGNVVTVPWRKRPCNGKIGVTVGPDSAKDYLRGSNCPWGVSGGDNTCLLVTRAWTLPQFGIDAQMGNWTYQEYRVRHGL